KREEKDGKTKIVIKQIQSIQQLQEHASYIHSSLYIRITKQLVERQGEIKKVLAKYHGCVDVFVYYEQEKKMIKFPQSLQVYPNDNCLFELKKIVGEENVVLTDKK